MASRHAQLPHRRSLLAPSAGETYVGPDELLGAAATGSGNAPLIAGLVHLDADTVAAAALDGMVAAQSIEGLAPAAAPSPAGSLDPVVNQVGGAAWASVWASVWTALLFRSWHGGPRAVGNACARQKPACLTCTQFAYPALPLLSMPCRC